MEKQELIAPEISELTKVQEGNRFVMRKGKQSLLASKVLLYSLLKIEDRTGKTLLPGERAYYRDLVLKGAADYGTGLVAEASLSELRNVLGKKSGSFYSSIKQLYSANPKEPKSLRNAWAVMLPDPSSGIMGYTEIIRSTHYDPETGKLFIKFNDEENVRREIFEIKENFTALPFLLMMEWKSIYSYRLYELLLSVFDTDGPLPKTARYQFGELLFLLNILDATDANVSAGARKSLVAQRPDYNEAADRYNDDVPENLHQFADFRRYALDPAVREINANGKSAFSVSYSVERAGRGGKVNGIAFTLSDKIGDERKPDGPGTDGLLAILAILGSEKGLSYGDIKDITETAEGNSGLVEKAYLFAKESGEPDSSLKEKICEIIGRMKK